MGATEKVQRKAKKVALKKTTFFEYKMLKPSDVGELVQRFLRQQEFFRNARKR